MGCHFSQAKSRAGPVQPAAPFSCQICCLVLLPKFHATSEAAGSSHTFLECMLKCVAEVSIGVGHKFEPVQLL